MAKWKLNRQTFGTEEFTFNEGEEVTIGRGFQNNITLSSLVISRNHCILRAKKNELLITDLQSSNGVFVGSKKITPNIPYALKDSDIVGIGWASNVPLSTVQDSEKFVFKVIKEQASKSIINRITFQNESEYDETEEEIANFDRSNTYKYVPSPVIDVKPPVKRKIDIEVEKCKNNEIDRTTNSSIIVLSDSDNESKLKHKEPSVKKLKLEPICEEFQKQSFESIIDLNNVINMKKETLKVEHEYPEMEAFNVKQEYFGYDDEPIDVDSDSDSESEHWYIRLSQSSPGKPFIKATGEKKDKKDPKPEDSSYSQIEDDFMADEMSDIEDDLIRILSPPPTDCEQPLNDNQDKQQEQVMVETIDNNKVQNIMLESIQTELSKNIETDEIDGFCSKDHTHELQNKTISTTSKNYSSVSKKAQMIEPLVQTSRKKSNLESPKSKTGSHKYDKVKKHSSKRNISDLQKEERKKKLKELALKEKEDKEQRSDKNNANNKKSISAVRVTSSNRGAFLTNSVQVVNPMTRKESPQRTKSDKEKVDKSEKKEKVDKSKKNKKAIKTEILEGNSAVEHKKKQTDKTEIKSEMRENIENKNKHSEKKYKKEHKWKHKHDSSKTKSKTSQADISSNTTITETRVPLKSLKPLTDSEDSFAGKPFSKVEPYKKTKKSVRFSEAPPEIRYFEIVEGNRMKKTSLVKTTLVDARKMPVFSLEKLTLMKILRWNPSWLDEQINNNEPPPILGHSNPPMTVFHSFANHNQYVQLIGDLILMEIWECLSIAYMKIRNHNVGLKMGIATLAPVPSPDRHFEIFNLSVDISVPTSEAKNVPRVGEVLLASFGPESTRRFFFVHNVRTLPSPPSNVNSFFNISLHTTFTEKMKVLKPGEIMIGVTLAYINKELSLFEAMAYMAGSPLNEVILRPEPRHFRRIDSLVPINIDNPWTNTLNPSQYAAVKQSVLAALEDQPSIQMVQGPPGTGKSSVICSIVMSYFYDAAAKKQQNRGKILICATSNAAVDELVLRLLNIRQQLPKHERFRMVRVGRAEAMHPRARDVSSQMLAQREVRSQQEPASQPGLNEEISRLEAKLNMWNESAKNAYENKDNVRVAYCETRVRELKKRIEMLRSSSSTDVLRPEQLVGSERRIIEGADIVVTTLSSAYNHKMRGLKRRIALCLVDEAGQAIEPETLIPLTLDVSNVTLIGDPQQLPGYICSQRAKRYGLGESLFSRLSSCSETWALCPVTLLDQQYRMQAAIAEYPNRAFYGGRVMTNAPPRPDLPIPPYMLLGIASGDKGQNAAGGNEMEAWGVSRVAAALGSMAAAKKLSLAVITPYNAHKDLIKRNLRHLQDPSELQIEVNTVDSFQGQERDVVVVSLARSHGVGFLTDTGRMNVMLTRARHALIVCLNPHAILKNHQWRTLLEDAQKRKLYRSLPTAMCQPSGPITSQDILKHISLK